MVVELNLIFAGAGLLTGGLIGYWLGRRRARREAPAAELSLDLELS